MKNRNSNELTICGIKAVDAIARSHPDRIHRLFFNADSSTRYGEVCRFMAANKRIYRLVTDLELEKVAGSIHHGGVAAVVDLPRLTQPSTEEVNTWCREQRRLIVLDSVANSHNLGAMVRTAAFLGIQDILISGGNHDDHLITSAMYRTAEGGMEHVSLWQIPKLIQFMDNFSYKSGLDRPAKTDQTDCSIAFIGADHRAKLDLTKLPEQLKPLTGNSVAIAVVMGNEETGISSEVAKRCFVSAKIVGSGNLESLNVAQAAAIFMFALGLSNPTKLR